MIQHLSRSLVRRLITAVAAVFGLAGFVAIIGEYGHRQIIHAHRNDFRDDPTLFTGEHIRREWTETVPAFRPWRDVTLALAEFAWPRIYDADAIAASDATGAAAVYVDYVYVPVDFSLETARLLPGVKLWVTSEHEHNGLRTGPVLSRLIDLAHGRRVR